MAYRFNMAAAALIMSVISGFAMAVKGPGDGAAVELGSARPVTVLDLAQAERGQPLQTQDCSKLSGRKKQRCESRRRHDRGGQPRPAPNGSQPAPGGGQPRTGVTGAPSGGWGY